MTARDSRWYRNLRSIESAAIAGLVFAGLIIVALTLVSGRPDGSESASEIATWYGDSSNQLMMLLSLNLVALGSIAFLWFVAVLRRRVGDREDRFFGTVFLGSGLIYIAVLLSGMAVGMAPALATSLTDRYVPEPDEIALVEGVASGLVLAVLPRLSAVFVFTTSTIVLRAKALPSWVAYVGYVFGITLFVVPFITRPVGYGFPVWVAMVSVVLLLNLGGEKASLVD